MIRIQQHTGYLPVDRAKTHLSGEERVILELLTELRVSEIDKLSAVDDERQIRAALDTFLARVQQQLAELSNVLTAAYFQKGDAIHQLVRMYPESRR